MRFQHVPAQYALDHPQEALITYLEHCASKGTASLAEDHQWLEKTTAELKQALLSRGLSAKLAEGFAPIVTPNAGHHQVAGI